MSHCAIINILSNVFMDQYIYFFTENRVSAFPPVYGKAFCTFNFSFFVFFSKAQMGEGTIKHPPKKNGGSTPFYCAARVGVYLCHHFLRT